MKILVKRIYNCQDYSIGHLYVDDKYICDTIEDTDRGLTKDMPTAEIAKKKVYGKTAIPTGTYKVLMNIVSPKFSLKQYYMDVCKGKVPRLSNVPGWEGILIHVGNTEKNSAGCLIVGKNLVKGHVLQSKQCFEQLYKILYDAYKKGEEITITITRTY